MRSLSLSQWWGPVVLILLKRKPSLVLEEKEQLITTFNERDVLIQPFIKSVVSEGEYSFMFFNRKYSHAVRKIAKTGEFRIQEEHGGRVEPYRSKRERARAN
jgi:glutathione synthase/RimK-type ligase-like ATP-grasp enzyme